MIFRQSSIQDGVWFAEILVRASFSHTAPLVRFTCAKVPQLPSKFDQII